MKTFKFIRVSAIVACVILVISIYSCGSSPTSKVVVTEANLTNDYEKLNFPVELHYIKKNGMSYMIASGTFGESGTSTTNLTLDSLLVEYYREQLNEKK
jgi:hypothetical protein